MSSLLLQCRGCLINEKKHIKIWAVALIFMYWLVYAVNMSTFALQTTTLGPFFPTARTSCPMTYPDGSSCDVVATELPKLKIGIVCLYEDPTNKKKGNNYWNQDLNKRIFDNRDAYANRHGYTIIKTPFDIIDKSRPIAWSKLLAIDRFLGEYDYVFYLDMDTVVLNMDITLESIIAQGCRSETSDTTNEHRFSFYSYKNVKPVNGHAGSHLVSEADVILTTDHNGPNTGSFLIKNSEFSHWLLKETFAQSQLVPPTQTNHGVTRSHPFEYEQRAFHYLLDTKVWADRQLPLYPGNISDIREHFRYVPQCTMNSYLLHPLYLSNSKIDRETEQYVSSDFIIHFAGVKGMNKVNMMNHFLTLARQKNHY